MSMVSIKILKGIIGLSLLGLLAYALLLLFKPVNPVLAETIRKPASKAVVDKGYEILPTTITANPSVQALIAENPGRVQLVNFFSYGCYGCYRWRPYLDTWSKKHAQKVAVYHVPILFNKAWEPFARVYYIVKALKKNDALDDLLFKTIQEQELDLTDKKTLGTFFEKQGVPLKTFEDLYDSFSVSQELLKAKNLAQAYHITLSPSVVLNTPQGSYLITPNSVPQGSGEVLMKILDQLTASSHVLPVAAEGG